MSSVEAFISLGGYFKGTPGVSSNKGEHAPPIPEKH